MPKLACIPLIKKEGSLFNIQNIVYKWRSKVLQNKGVTKKVLEKEGKKKDKTKNKNEEKETSKSLSIIGQLARSGESRE